jgi:hypothetical protein
MFFIIGIANGEKKLEFMQTDLCRGCGQFGQRELYMTYMYFCLFFIPIVKWNVRYYIKTSCCNTVYELDYGIGKRIRQGETVSITEEMLHRVSGGNPRSNTDKCCHCGYPAASDFEYCPKCGTKL